MLLKECCEKAVITVEPQTPVLEAARLMREKHVGDLVVVEREDVHAKPVGILTDRDLVTLVMAEDVNVEMVKVADVMAKHPIVVRETEDLSDAVQRMAEASVRRVPVVDGEGWLVGILTVDDLWRLMAAQMKMLADISLKQRALEKSGKLLGSRF